MTMKQQLGSWLKLLTFCTAATLAAALGLGVLLVSASVALAGAESSPEGGTKHVQAVASESTETESYDPAGKNTQTFAGLIADSRCGARHPMDSNKTSAECARSCVRNGSRYVLVDGEKSYVLEGKTSQLEKLAGERVEILGQLAGDSIRVKSVSALDATRVRQNSGLQSAL
jgi:hypothetical protein